MSASGIGPAAAGDSRRCARDSMEVDTAGIDAQLAIVLSYKGAPFAGFARQPGRFTVQGNLEDALSMALRRPVQVVCAGRTDAGVHARGQVVSFPIGRDELESRNLSKLKRSLQALTDDAIAIQSISVMPPAFSARFSAISREYRYLVVPGARKPLFLGDWCWDVHRDLDIDAMNAAARILQGEHDFKSFCLAASAEGKNTVRRLDRVRVVPVSILGEGALSIRVEGTAFLHSMVRAIVGTLVMVGSGARPPEWVQEVLEARDRRAAGENAPAAGLVFWRVSYRGDVPSYEHDALTPAEGAYRIPVSHATPVEGDGAEAVPPVTSQDVKVAAAVMDFLERRAGGEGWEPRPQCEPGDRGENSPHPGGPEPNAPTGSADAFADAALDAKLPAAVWAAVDAPGPEGTMRRNEPAGPAVAAAPRKERIAPADPQPAEGEVSLSFEVPREAAATRAAIRQKKRGGFLSGLFGKDGGSDA